ncbi:MAG: ribosome-associated translation inhibitor RaiA [bacterium]
MRVVITSKTLELTDSIRDHIQKRLLKLTRYFDGVLECHVVLKVERFTHRFEITLHGQGFDLFSEAQAEDMYAAFDSAAEKMERQVRKTKEKIRGKRGRRAGAPQAVGAEAAEDEDLGEGT